jgi:hypothetical protein
LLILLFATSDVASAQRGVGELRLRVTDDTGAAIEVSGTISGAATQVDRSFVTRAGVVVLAALPFGRYVVSVLAPGFSSRVDVVDVESAVPLERTLALTIAPLQTTVTVIAEEGATLVNPTRTGSVRFLGGTELQERVSPAPGRSLIDLVSTQPGWVLEANGVLHARGSEYQVQYVVDGIPLRDNRSPAFAQLFGVHEFDAVSVRTGGYPAEFGGKLGGVVEVNTARDLRRGAHGAASFDVGSFATFGGDLLLQYGGARTLVAVGLEGSTTDRYLDPPVEDNFSNHGASRGVSARIEHAWSDSARVRVYAYGRRTRFDVPNEAIQEAVGQRQARAAGERLGQVVHQQAASSSLLVNLGFMARRTEARLTSNAASTPIRASQDRGVTEGYVNGSVTSTRGMHEIRAGGEATFASVHEAFDAFIASRRFGGIQVFDSSIPDVISFADDGHLDERAAFVQDRVRLGPVTLSAGLRFDAYRLVAKETAWSPRLSGAWNLGQRGLVVHASYDRTFEPQPIENLLIASADAADRFGDDAVSRPLRPTRGHFVEVGVAAPIARHVRIESAYFERRSRDVTDDEVLLNSGVSFPIAFASARVHGWELAADVPSWGRVSGSASYSYSRGVGRLPFTGGLFIQGDEAGQLDAGQTLALTQDQRHTFRGRLRAGIGPRAWTAVTAHIDSGLPVELEDGADVHTLAAQYGARVVGRVDVDAGRVRPSWTVALSGGLQLTGSSPSRGLRLQCDVFNVLDRLNVINFAGLLSGTALARSRSVALLLGAGF